MPQVRVRARARDRNAVTPNRQIIIAGIREMHRTGQDYSFVQYVLDFCNVSRVMFYENFKSLNDALLAAGVREKCEHCDGRGWN